MACCLAFVGNLYGQGLNGRVINAENADPIPFATIYNPQTGSGVEANAEGYFSFSNELPENKRLVVRAATFETLIVDTTVVENLILRLRPVHLNLEDVVVSVPGGKLGEENAFHVDRLALKELNSIQSSTLPEAIGKINGVQTASVGPGISKPVIRGFQGTRILTLVNGVRIENQQWGSDHGMAANELGIGHVEVIKGPSSLLFGNDALGGVIFLVDQAYTGNDNWSLDLHSRGETVNASNTNSLVFKKSFKKVRFLVGGLYTTAADYQLPNGTFAKDSRFNQYGGKFNISYSGKKWVSHLRYSLSNGRFGVVGHTHDSIPDPSSFVGTQQGRKDDVPAQLISNHLLSWQNKYFHKRNELDIVLSHSANRLIEFEDKLTIPALNEIQANELLRIGPSIQAQIQSNRNEPTVEERLLPDFRQNDIGFYTLVSKKLKRTSLDFGGRVDHRFVQSDNDFTRNYTTYNFSAGFVRKFKSVTGHFNLSSGTRLPHISELLSDGAHHGSIRYEKGDANLKEEQSYQADLNVELDKEHLRFQVNPHYAFIKDFILLTPHGTVVDALPVFQYEQVNEAYLFGVDASLHYHPHFAHWLHLESAYSYVRAHDRAGQSLPLIPQGNLNNALSVHLHGKKWFSIKSVNFQHEVFFEQNFITKEETASKTYNLLNASIQMNLGKQWDLNVGVKNIANVEYINHLSSLKNIGVFSPGRTIYLGINFNIKNKRK